MTRAESAPQKQEDITPADRKELMATVNSFLTGEKLGIMMDRRLEAHAPFMLVPRLMGLREAPDTNDSQRNYLGKMVALGVKQFPAKLPAAVKSMEEFMNYLVAEIPVELSTVAGFPDDLKKLPSPWNKALIDLRKSQKFLLGQK